MGWGEVSLSVGVVALLLVMVVMVIVVAAMKVVVEMTAVVVVEREMDQSCYSGVSCRESHRRSRRLHRQERRPLAGSWWCLVLGMSVNFSVSP
jgi:hypothetical protein